MGIDFSVKLKGEYGLVVECDLPKVETGVRFPLLAQLLEQILQKIPQPT